MIYVVLTCYYPHTLGMESGQILDSQITASSSRNESYAPKRGRLNYVPFIKRGEWMPLANVVLKLVIFDILIRNQLDLCCQRCNTKKN